MKIALYILGGLVVLSGVIWILQGINILPGSFMSGNPQWAINGAIAVVIGGAIIYMAGRKK